MNHIEMLRDELLRSKENFDRRLCAQPLLSREQRLARWELFLGEMRPIAERLSKAERHVEVLATRRIEAVREYVGMRA